MRGLYKKATVTHTPAKVVHTPDAVVHAVVHNKAMTTAERQRAWRQAHLEEYRKKNRERMRARRASSQPSV